MKLRNRVECGDPVDGSYDVAYREAVADIITIKSLLMDNRPLEALQVAVEADERYDPPRYGEDTDTNESGTFLYRDGSDGDRDADVRISIPKPELEQLVAEWRQEASTEPTTDRGWTYDTCADQLEALIDD